MYGGATARSAGPGGRTAGSAPVAERRAGRTRALFALLATLLVALAAAHVPSASASETVIETPAAGGVTEESGKPSNTALPMMLQADEVLYDNDNARVTARGNVEIYYNGYVLQADTVIYDQAANTLTAEGNVRIKEPNGATINAEHITLTEDFRDGFIQSLSIVAKDESRIAAASATRKDAETTVFEKGVYTPCKPCKDNPDAAPIWRIRAGKITHVRSEANLYYEDASLDFFGVPVVYLPYFYSPDPSVKRRSGFLAPAYGYSDTLGYQVELPYFWALAPNMDVTFNPRYLSKEGILWKGTFRHRIWSGAYKFDFAGVFSNDDEDILGGLTSGVVDETGDTGRDFRGSIVTKGRFSLGSWWELGWDGTLETDDTFRRKYDLDNIRRTDRVSEIHIVGQSERNYYGAYLYHFGGLLADDVSSSEARALPSTDYHYVLDTPVLGGELGFDVNTLSLTRELNATAGNELNQIGDAISRTQNHIVAEARWRRQLIDPLGQVFTPFFGLRGDFYQFDAEQLVDADVGFNPGTGTFLTNQQFQSIEDTELRGLGLAGLQYQFPFVSHTSFGSHVIEPVVQVVSRTADDEDGLFVPNEDAQSLVFDDTLLFDIDKFSGYDLIETGTRVNAGIRYSWEFDDGGSIRVVVGQSYQVAGDNPFGNRTGLDTDSSDYVTGLYFAPTRSLQLVSQTRFDSTDLAVRRADIGLMASYDALASGTVTYSFDNSNDELNERRNDSEVIATGKVALAEHWTLLGSLRYKIDDDDLVKFGSSVFEDSNGLRSSSLGLAYGDECFTLAVTYLETRTRDRDIEPTQSVMIRFELKNLGGTTVKADPILDYGAETDTAKE